MRSAAHVLAGSALAATLATATSIPSASAAPPPGGLALATLETLETVPPPAATDWLVERPARRAGVYRGDDPGVLVLDNGLVRRSFLLTPNVACVGFTQLTTGVELVRAVGPECEVTIDGDVIAVGGLTGQPVGNYILPEWYDDLHADPAALAFRGFATGPIVERFAWKPRREWMAIDAPWPPPGVQLTLHFRSGAGAERPVEVDVHYALYDGCPLIAKWFTLRNVGSAPFTLDTFAAERLAMVEASSEVEEGGGSRRPNVHVETDFTTASMSGEGAQRQTVRWLTDPAYLTQVNYQRQTRCLLECRPPLGPAVEIAPGDAFESFRTWIMAFDGTDQSRRTLSLGRLYRTIAPWVAENPLIFHVRSARPESIRAAIEQAADVGFELVIMTFGSGFDIENRSPEYVGQITTLVDEAHARGVALGGYSLLASRSVSPDDDVVNPETGKPGGFARFGNSPCLGSAWGQRYFETLYAFFAETGSDVLEHDGSYPGDACASAAHPGHRDYDDSRWAQWRVITEFYRWCRGRGIYLNVPDWYFLSGSSKTGMGYRETNWSLPREQQELIERQNIADGCRFKTPTMGWMFVPLTQYHGGGAAATIEPLHEHLDHYERRLQNLLGAGVQACFRGPRLYDTPETRAMVKRWVDWYKDHRAILESDLLVLRRADGRDWDGWLHVNPALPERALAAIYNPRPAPLTRTIELPLYYAGLSGTATIRIDGGAPRTVALSRDHRVTIDIELAPRGFTWIVVEAAD